MVEFMDFGEKASRRELAKLTNGVFELSEEQDDGSFIMSKLQLVMTFLRLT